MTHNFLHLFAHNVAPSINNNQRNKYGSERINPPCLVEENDKVISIMYIRDFLDQFQNSKKCWRMPYRYFFQPMRSKCD